MAALTYYDRPCSFIITKSLVDLDTNHIRPQSVRVSVEAPNHDAVKKDFPDIPPFSLDHKTLAWSGLGQEPNGHLTLYTIRPVWRV